ncbi:MAG: hypothetical protein P8X88_09565 [Gammaproteobacteria bacterium]
MDGNRAKKEPILDHLEGTTNAPSSGNKPTFASMNGEANANNSVSAPNAELNSQADKQPKNRRTDKSQFEIELTNMVNRIMLKHFEHASEQIVQQVLSEVRARLPCKRKS